MKTSVSRLPTATFPVPIAGTTGVKPRSTDQLFDCVSADCSSVIGRQLVRCGLALLVVTSTACGPIITQKEGSSPIKSAMAQPKAATKCTPEQAKAILKEAGKDTVYGEGMGKVALNVAAMIVFPPFAIYRLGQAGASLLGYQVDVTNALPEPASDGLSTAYSAVSSVPGRAAAAIADEDYRGGVDPMATLNEQSNCSSPTFADRVPMDPPTAVASKEGVPGNEPLSAPATDAMPPSSL